MPIAKLSTGPMPEQRRAAFWGRHAGHSELLGRRTKMWSLPDIADQHAHAARQRDDRAPPGDAPLSPLRLRDIRPARAWRHWVAGGHTITKTRRRDKPGSCS
jgi:hypothetical protein